MDKDILKGLKISFGIILGLSLLFGIVYAVGFHIADEIIGGTFLGNYTFTNNVVFNGKANFTNANVSGINTSNGIPSGLIASFNSSSCPSGWIKTNGEIISSNSGSVIGNMVNKALLFDDNTFQAYASGPYGNNMGDYGGKDWGVGNNKIITKYVVYSASNYGFGNFGNGGDQTQIITLRGSTDGTNWIILHNDTFQETSAVNVMKTYININTSVGYRYHSVSFSSANSNSKVSEIIFYENVLCGKQ